MAPIASADPAEQLQTLLRDGRAALDELRELAWWKLSEPDLLDGIRSVESLLRSGFGVQVRVASELDERILAPARGYRSTAGMLADLLNISAGQARDWVAAAAVVLPPELPSDQAPQPPALPVLAAAIDAGSVSAEHSSVVVRTMVKIPDKVDAELRAECERLLVSTAVQSSPARLREVAEQVRNITDPDGTLSDLDVRDRVDLSIGNRRPDRLTPFNGLLDDIGVEALRQAIDPLTAPRPAGPDLPDTRPAGVRRGQALIELITRYLTFGDGPTNGGVRPHVSVSMNLSDLIRFSSSDAGPQPAPSREYRDADEAPGWRSSSESPGSTSASAAGSDRPPDSRWSGPEPGPRAARLDYAGTVSARTARLIACDGGILPIVLGGDGRPLDASPEARFFSPVQRRVLVARDIGCAFPSCDIPAGWCDAHHVEWFERGGPTTVDNGALLCGFHHHVIHRGDWTMQMAADGRPEFVPPAWLDPGRTPRRNHRWAVVRLGRPGGSPSGERVPQ